MNSILSHDMLKIIILGTFTPILVQSMYFTCTIPKFLQVKRSVHLWKASFSQQSKHLVPTSQARPRRIRTVVSTTNYLLTITLPPLQIFPTFKRASISLLPAFAAAASDLSLPFPKWQARRKFGSFFAEYLNRLTSCYYLLQMIA